MASSTSDKPPKEEELVESRLPSIDVKQQQMDLVQAPIKPALLQQGAGSKLDSDTVRNIQASMQYSPNSILALDNNSHFKPLACVPQGAGPATPNANTLYNDNIVKAWAQFNPTGVIQSDFGVTSVA